MRVKEIGCGLLLSWLKGESVTAAADIGFQIDHGNF